MPHVLAGLRDLPRLQRLRHLWMHYAELLRHCAAQVIDREADIERMRTLVNSVRCELGGCATSSAPCSMKSVCIAQIYRDVVDLYSNALKQRGDKAGKLSKTDFPKLAQMLFIPEQVARLGNGDLQTTAWGEAALKSFIDVKALTNWGRNAVENVFNHIALVLTSEVGKVFSLLFLFS